MIKSLLEPKYYIIEPTNVCNYKCSICSNRLYSKEEQGYMDWALFVRLLSQINDCAQVIQLNLVRDVVNITWYDDNGIPLSEQGK